MLYVVQLPRDGLIRTPLTDSSDRSQIISQSLHLGLLHGSVLPKPPIASSSALTSLFLREDPVRFT